MYFSNEVQEYIPLLSVADATDRFKECCGINMSPIFIESLIERKIIRARPFAKKLFIHPKMFDNLLEKHKNSGFRVFLKEGYIQEIDVRKYLEKTDKYSRIGANDVKVLFEHNLLGTPLCFQNKTQYILESNVEEFCQKDKLFCHSDIIDMITDYFKDNSEVKFDNLLDAVGFDIENPNSLIQRSYLKPKYISDNILAKSYFANKAEVDICMDSLKLLIQKNIKNKVQQLVMERFNCKFTVALENKAMIINRLKPFYPVSKIQKTKSRDRIKEKIHTANKIKEFLINSIDNIDIHTNFNAFLKELRTLVGYGFDSNIYTNISKMNKNKVSISLDEQIQMYEDALFDTTNI